MKALLVLAPILLVATMLASAFGFDSVAYVCWFAFLGDLLAVFLWATYLAMQDTKERFATPDGWSEAQTLYPSRGTIEGPRIRGFIKESGRAKFFLCGVRFDKDGVLIEDRQLPLFSGELFVTWDSLEAPREIDLPWRIWYASLWREATVELAIRGTKLSFIVTKSGWARHAVG